MKSRSIVMALVLGAAGVRPAAALDPRYPDWPCSQAKVPEISLAAVWAGPPLDDLAPRWRDDPRIHEMVARLAARRTPLADAEQMAADFLAQAPADRTERGKALFRGLFDRLNAERSTVMSGLERVTRKQRRQAEKIRSDTLELENLQEATSPDQAKIAQLSSQLAWETRIFEDRRHVVRFVCEAPVAIDQRIFALGRAIQQAMEE